MIGLSNHPWMSGLFGDDEMSALFAPEAELQRFLKVEAAWTRALGKVAGSTDAEPIAQAILTADIAPDDLKDGFARDGVPIPALIQLLKSKLGKSAIPWVHVGMTSQDVLDTALVLTLREILEILARRLAILDDHLAEMQHGFGNAPVMAITRMQPALETTAADVIARWRQPLKRLSDDCAAACQDVAVIQYGGPIGSRDHNQTQDLASAFAKALNLSDRGQAWHTDRTTISDVGHVMGRISTATGKIGEDIALMAAIGVDQITLTGGTSSAMSHKNNPVKAEVLIALSDHVASLQSNLTRSARHEGFRSGQAWMLEWITLPQMCMACGAGLRISDALLSDIQSIGTKHI